MNKVILQGRLVKDPELRYTKGGTAYTSFTLAVPRRFPNKKTGERETDFINCVSWTNTAEFIAQYFEKGQQMLLEGRLQVRTYDDNNGQRRWVTEVFTEQVDFCGSKGDSSGSRSSAPSKAPAATEREHASDYNGLGEEIVIDDNDLPF